MCWRTGWKHISEALEQASSVHLTRNNCHDEEESL